MAYFITDEDSTKERDPNINIINSIHNIKGKTTVNFLVSNYTNKHIKFNKGEYIGCLEPTITDNMTSDQLSHKYSLVTIFNTHLASNISENAIWPKHIPEHIPYVHGPNNRVLAYSNRHTECHSCVWKNI